MTIQCPTCQADVVPNSSFCSKCGNRILDDDQAPESQAAANQVPDSERGAGAALRRAAARMGQGDDPEAELWRGGYSGKSMLGSWVTAGLLSLVTLVLGIAFAFTGVALVIALISVLGVWLWLACVLAYRRLSVRYTLTNQRFVHERGVLARRTDRVEVIDIDDVSFKQGLIERFLNVGTIELVSSDRTDPRLTLLGIDDVKRVAGLIDDARRSERRKRGLHIEQV